MKRKKIRTFIAWFLIALMLCSEVTYAGQWNNQNGTWYYEDNGINQTGWIEDTGNWYFMDPSGAMQTGWHKEHTNDWYYLNTKSDGVEGLMRTGWFLQNNVWYFLNPVHDGYYGRAIAGHWQWIDGYCYLFDADGRMYANCETPDGYMVNADGQWTVNGIVQYIPGKGIITKPWQIGEGGSGGSGGSDRGGSGGGSGSGGSGGSGGGSSSGGTTSGGNSSDSSGGESSSGSGTGDQVGVENCKIVIKYVNQEDGTVLKTKEVTGEDGELYVVQHPSILDYKIVENQTTETRFDQSMQELVLYYRPLEANEEQEEVLVAKDNLKAIIPRSEEEKAIVEEIREEIFSYEIFEDDSEILCVSNENPLLAYVLDGTYNENDIIYIEACDAFPAGLTLVYLGHDDNYTGKYEGYDPSLYEVLYVKHAGLLDILAEGTYIGGTGEAIEDAEFEVAYSWIPEYEGMVAGTTQSEMTEAIMLVDSDSSGVARTQELNSEKEKPEFERKISADGKTIEISTSLTIPLDQNGGESKVEINPSLKVTPTLYDPVIEILDKPLEIEMMVDVETEFNYGLAFYLEGDLFKALKDKEGNFKNNPKNEVTLNFLANGTLSGVSFEDSLLLGVVGLRLKWGKPEFVMQINDVFKDTGSALAVNPIIAILPMADLNAKGKVSAEANAGIQSYVRIGGRYTNDGETDTFVNLSEFGHTREQVGVIPRPRGTIGLKAEVEEGKAGMAMGAGVSVFGIMPVMGKVSSGIKASGSIDMKGDFELGRTPLCQVTEVSGAELKLNSYIAIEALMRLMGTLDIGGMEIKPTLEERLPLIEEESELFSYPISTEEGTLHVFEDSSVLAVDEWGNNVSKKYKGYDASTKTVKAQFDHENSGHYSFHCPEYYLAFDNNGDIKTYETTTIDVRNTRCNNLDLTYATGLKRLLLSNVPLTSLDVSQNMFLTELHMTNVNLETFTGNGIVFPPGDLKWYSDEHKRYEVTVCGEGQTIYSEFYNPVTEWKEKVIYFSNSGLKSASFTAVDEMGNIISDQFKGYDPETNTVKAVYEKTRGTQELYSFQCPQYILDIDEETRVLTYYKIIGVRLWMWATEVPCCQLDLSKVKELEVLNLKAGGNLEEVILPETNKIKELYFGASWGYFIDTEKMDFSIYPELESLTIYSTKVKEADLSDNDKLTYLYIGDCSSLDTLILPQDSMLETFVMEDATDITELNLENQKKLKKLTLTDFAHSIEHLDVSNCPDLTEDGFNISGALRRLKTFCGNGKVFPTDKDEGEEWIWYSDPEKTHPITADDYLGHNYMIYSDKYEPEVATVSYTLRKTSSNANAVSKSNADVVSDSNASIVSGSNAVEAPTEFMSLLDWIN